MNDLFETIEDKKDLYTIITLKKEQVLFHEGDLCKEIGIILQGQIAIISYMEDGRQIIFNRLNKSGIFGNNLLFSSEPYYKGNIIATLDSRIALIKKEDLLKLLENDSTFMLEYLRILSDQGKQLNFKIRLLSLDLARDRFYHYMHDHKNHIVIGSISELASELFLSRETLSRLLNSLIREKRIIKDGKHITLL